MRDKQGSTRAVGMKTRSERSGIIWIAALNRKQEVAAPHVNVPTSGLARMSARAMVATDAKCAGHQVAKRGRDGEADGRGRYNPRNQELTPMKRKNNAATLREQGQSIGHVADPSQM